MLSTKVINRISSPWFIIIIFSVLGLIGILNHSMWRDELNPWLIVRDSESFTDLIANIRYEGHPILWYFSLAFLIKIADNPIIMQIFHLAMTIASVTLFWLHSPFNYKQKFLFTFGFFPFYEYFLISRNYAFSMLFLFAACTIFSSRKKTYLYLAIILGLLANSSVYALLVSFSLLLTLCAEFCFDSEHRKQYLLQSRRYDLFLSIGIIILYFLLSVSIITPPVDSYLHGGLSNGWSIKLDFHNFLKSLGRLFGSYFLIIPSQKKWLDLIICGVITIFLVTLTLLKLCKKPFPLFFYVVGNCIIFTFTYLRFTGTARHYGHFYLVLIGALWLEKYYRESTFLIDKFSIHQNSIKNAQKWQYIIFIIILTAHFLGGIFAFSKDLIIPFSASRETSHYIKKSHLENEFIVASRDANMAALAGYLNRKFYYPELQNMGSFTLFKEGRNNVEQVEILRQINSIFNSQKEKDRILLILNKKLNFNRNDLKIIPIKSFERAWTDSERYYIYWVSKA